MGIRDPSTCHQFPHKVEITRSIGSEAETGLKIRYSDMEWEHFKCLLNPLSHNVCPTILNFKRNVYLFSSI